MKYRYIGNDQNLHLPKFNIFVERHGSIVESEKPIDNPDFEPVSDEEVKQEEKEAKREERKKK